MTTASRRPLRPEDVLTIKSISDVQISPDGSRIALALSQIDAEKDEVRSSIWMVPAEGGEPVQFTRGPKRDTAPRWSPDGRSLAFLSVRGSETSRFSDDENEEPQLYVMPVAGGEPRRLTSLHKGAGAAVWSPDGRSILFAARVSKEKPPEDREERGRWERRPRVVTRAHYKDDGSGYTFNAGSQLFVLPVDGGEPKQITEGEAESRQPAWSPDGRRIAFVRTRTGTADYNMGDLWVCDADPGAPGQAGGNARQITENVGRVTAPSWSPDGKAIACYGGDEQRRTMGGEMTRVWSVPADGGAPANLTAGYDRSAFQLQLPPPAPVWSEDGASVTFNAADAGNVHIVRAIDGTVRPILTGERQITMASMLPGKRIAFVASDPEIPGDIFIANWDGSGERRLTRVNEAVLAELQLPVVERRSFPSPNGETIDGWLVRPATGSGPAPMLVVIHGGPHGFVGNVFKLGTFYEFVLASRGWATLALNPSGSGSYGEEFMQSLMGRWGEYDLPEQHAAIDALVAEGIADPDRLAVTGYSYGGYMTSWVVGHTDRFKAAVIGAPVTNLESFHGTSDIGMWFGAGEMKGDIFAARETFRRLSPVNYVDRVTTPTLILHGEADDRCPIGQGEEFFVGLVAQGKVPCELVRYPGGSHLFVGQGRPSHRVDYSRRVVDWVERYALAGASRPREMAAATGND